MGKTTGSDRRDFLKTLGLASTAAMPARANAVPQPHSAASTEIGPVEYPRKFTGSALKMLSFPLGGVCAGSVGLGGRGQLRDWEIFNRPNYGGSLLYSFASIWVRSPGTAPIAHVLESRIEPPYEGQDGLGSRNAPGLSRLQGATFTGEFPIARVDFHDSRLPVKVSLLAGTPFIPLDPDASGLPIAHLRYQVKNASPKPATVSIAFSLENPVKQPTGNAHDKRVNELRGNHHLRGLFMHNPGLAADDPDNGTFVLAALNPDGARFSSLRGWPAGRWWDSPLLFWDDFSTDGELGPEPGNPSAIGALCLQREIAPGKTADFSFLLAWQFPNRTPRRCGWEAPKGHENDLLGNWYATKFTDAWAVAEDASENLPDLERRTRRFVQAMRDSTLPAAVKEAAMANLSTFVTPTCFRTADGEFHAFEGSDDHIGCCFGNCTHVWNYETATSHLFPSFSHSLRRSAFGYSMDERGGMHFRQLLPDGIARYPAIAADGQMGQIMKAYIDWQLSGDPALLKEFWPKVKRAVAFAWIPGGWDANRDGVMEGVQHNTYDVEFYGPNPLCGIYYLGALRAAEEMAKAAGDTASASEYRRLFENGKHWFDANLFNGSYYIQKVEGRPASDIAAGLREGAGAEDPEHPQYQVGGGCLVDQLIGQYLAGIAGLGPLLDPQRIRKTLESVYRNNHRATLVDHDCVERTYALNDESALIVCDYPNGHRPRIPFPYFAEAWTGLEYLAAALMLGHGMHSEGVQVIAEARRRYDGIRRNPWDECECGHHYARPMAAWSAILTLSGFQYRGPQRYLIIDPPLARGKFRSFWSCGTGWGTFSLPAGGGAKLRVIEGNLPLRTIELPARGPRKFQVSASTAPLQHSAEARNGRAIVRLAQELELTPQAELTFTPSP